MMNRVVVGGLPWLAALLVVSSACSSPRTNAGVYGQKEGKERYGLENRSVPTNVFVTAPASPSALFATPDDVKKLSQEPSRSYRLGPGDRFAFVVRGRPDISRENVIVAPDGEVALPRAGVVNVSGKTILEATTLLSEKLAAYYENPEVTLVVQEFNNNKVFVLGRVAQPGAVKFGGPGSLLEALALAGGLPVDTQKSFLSRCMILRGKDMVVWIDLRDLLENGNMTLNLPLQNNDIIFIPQSEDQLAYIMGEVQSPGVLEIRSTMTLMDAVMTAGGPTQDADVSRVYLARTVDGKGIVDVIDIRDFLARGDQRKNYVLKDGDIVYVSERGVSRFNYYLSQVLPSMQAIDFSLNTLERFGVMAELRAKLWGQSGFVNSTP